jgi:4-hydroxy-tetrahydrodipicolinate synthase
MKLDGIIVPLLTPLCPDDSLDEAALEKLIDHALAGGATGIFLLGSTGEFPLISQENKIRLIQAAREHLKGQAPLLVGICEVSTRRAIESGQLAVDLGATAVVAAPPYYYRHRQSELITHFKTIAGAIDAPVVLYNIPQNVKLTLEAETVLRLAEIPSIVGLKDSAGDLAVFQQYLDVRRHRPDFGVAQGSELVAALSLLRGADGLVLGLSNVAPRLCRDLFDATRHGDLDEAWRMQEQLREMRTIVKYKSGFAGMKTACHLLGLCGRTVSAPFEQLDSDQIEMVRLTLTKLGLL